MVNIFTALNVVGAYFGYFHILLKNKYSDICEEADRFCEERMHVSCIWFLEADHIEAKNRG